MDSSNSSIKEYIIDKNYINKNTFQDLKDLLKVHEKIKITTSPKYVSIAFQVTKELNIQGLSTYDDELKVERDFTNQKRKTYISITIKRKPKIFEYLIGKDYFYKNIYTEIKSHLNIHNKVTIVAKPGEVGIAFKVANQLKEGSAIYDEELKLDRNFKEGQGSTKVYISLKKRNKKINKEIEINNNNIIDDKKINEENNIIINENTSKELIVEKNCSYDKLMKNIKNKFDKNNNQIILIANKDNISTVFNVIKTLKKKVIFEEELNVKHEIKKGKGRAKIYISIRKL